MTRFGNTLTAIDTNQQFDDSLENIENKENSSSSNTTFTKDNHKSIFYEIPNTPVSVKRSRRFDSKVRDEIRKSLTNKITLQKTEIEKQQQLAKQKEILRKFAKRKEDDINTTYVKNDKKIVRNKEKICDVIYLKTIDNLLKAIDIELNLGKINSAFVDDRKYIEIFQENANKLAVHLHAKLKFNSALKILRWYRNQLAIRKAKQILSDLKIRRDAVIVFQKTWRGRQARKKYVPLIKDHVEKRQNAARIIQQDNEKRTRIELKRNQSALIIQRCWRRYIFLKQLSEQIRSRNEMLRTKSVRTIQRNWRTYKFRCVLDELVRKRALLRQEELMINWSVLVLQRNWRVYVIKKRLASLAQQRREEVCSIRNQSALRIQRAWRKHSLRRELAIRRQKREQILVEQKLERERLLEKIRLNVASSKIQRAWANYLRVKKSAIIIQSNWRTYCAKKQLAQLRLAHEQANCAARILQRNWRQYVFRTKFISRLESNRVKKQQAAALIIQRAWRSWQHRKQVNEENKYQVAAIQIQKTWRGFATRLKSKRNNKRVSGIFERISEVNRRSEQQTTVGEKTKLAIQKLLNYKYHGTALNCLQELEKTTNLSNESCIQMANVTIIEVLLKVISECNRSEPCLQIIKLAYSVILNIAKNEKALPLLCSIQSLKDSILETLNKHYKRTGIFLKTMTLLYILLSHENFPNSPAFTIKIRRLLSKISENHEFTTRIRKNEKASRYEFDPRWISKAKIRTQFYTTKQTIEAFYQIYAFD